jgi:hypothetical protein
MIKRELLKDDVRTLLKMLDYCQMCIESQYQAGQYSQENYNNFHTLLMSLSRIQKSRDIYFTRYLSQKEKEAIEKCFQIGQLAALDGCKAQRIAPTVPEEITRLYGSLQEF